MQSLPRLEDLRLALERRRVATELVPEIEAARQRRALELEAGE